LDGEGSVSNEKSVVVKTLSPARIRAFLPVCPPAPWQPLLAFVLVTITAVALLDRGVRDTVLPLVLATIGWLTTIVAGTKTRLLGAVIV
jgi:hypothetical protein